MHCYHDLWNMDKIWYCGVKDLGWSNKTTLYQLLTISVDKLVEPLEALREQYNYLYVNIDWS